MEKLLLQNETEMKREHVLTDSCDFIEKNYSYLKAYAPEELAQERETLSETMITASVIEDEFKVVKDLYKDKLKPLRDEVKISLEIIKNKGEFVSENVYIMIDHEEKMAGYYNRLGELIHSRPLRPEEMQKTIHQELKEGTND